MLGLLFLIHSLTWLLRPFLFNVIVNMVRSKNVILLFIFCLSYPFFVSFPLLFYFLWDYFYDSILSVIGLLTAVYCSVIFVFALEFIAHIFNLSHSLSSSNWLHCTCSIRPLKWYAYICSLPVIVPLLWFFFLTYAINPTIHSDHFSLKEL